MQAQLSNVLEAKLIADGSVDSEKFNETVLRCTEAILDVITSTTDFGGAEELVVHSLQSGFVEDRVLGPHDQGAKGVEGQDDGIGLVRPVTWTVHPSRECYSEREIGPDRVELAFGGIAEDSPIVVMRVTDIGNLSFKPPWRENPIKIMEFLRGQKVPLSRRGEAEVLCLVPPEESPQILAVYVENSKHGDHGDSVGRWIARSSNDNLVTKILMVRS